MLYFNNIHKYTLLLVFLGFSTTLQAQKCSNHASEVQLLFNQLQKGGFDTKQPIDYAYYFLDTNPDKLYRLQATLQSQGYKPMSISKKNTKYELAVDKKEIHTAQSLIARGAELSRISHEAGVETFDGFEMQLNDTSNNTNNTTINDIKPSELYQKGITFYNNHEDKKALAVFDRCIALGINLPDSYYKRANTKTALGNKVGAITDLEAAIRLNPNFFEANYNLAGLYLDNKNFESAIRYYQSAVLINTRSDNAYYRLASAQYQMGQKNLAIKNCQKSLELNANNTYAKELLTKIK